jgi:hypothetical protein
MTLFDYCCIYGIIATTIGLCLCFILLGVWLCADIKTDKKGRK